MKLYLVQHGDAVDKSVDPDRPLSAAGKEAVRAIASVLVLSGDAPKRIFHSGKTRARQTAEIFRDVLDGPADIGEIPGIAPLDSVVEFAERITTLGENTMVCGHQPFMGKLVSHLLMGDAQAPGVEYLPGSVACLDDKDGGAWVLCWFLRPELCSPG